MYSFRLGGVTYCSPTSTDDEKHEYLRELVKARFFGVSSQWFAHCDLADVELSSYTGDFLDAVSLILEGVTHRFHYLRHWEVADGAGYFASVRNRIVAVLSRFVECRRSRYLASASPSDVHVRRKIVGYLHQQWENDLFVMMLFERHRLLELSPGIDVDFDVHGRPPRELMLSRKHDSGTWVSRDILCVLRRSAINITIDAELVNDTTDYDEDFFADADTGVEVFTLLLSTSTSTSTPLSYFLSRDGDNALMSRVQRFILEMP